MKSTTPFHIILKVVSEYFFFEPIEIFDKSRKTNIIFARQWFHYLSRTLNPAYRVSSEDIGAYYSDVTGYKIDHATVLNSVKRIKGYIEIYKECSELEKYFTQEIYSLTYTEKLIEHKNIPSTNTNIAI